LSATDLPREARRIVQGSFGGASIDTDENRPVLEFGRCSAITGDDFLRVHDANVVAPSTGDGTGESRVRINEGSFDLESRHIVHAVPMDHVRNFEAGHVNLPNPLELVVDHFVGTNLFPDVGKYSISTALADVERLSVTGVDQSIHVGLQLFRDAERKCAELCLIHVRS